MSKGIKEILSRKDKALIRQRRLQNTSANFLIGSGIRVKSGDKFLRKQGKFESGARKLGGGLIVLGKKAYEFEEAERPKVEKALKKGGFL